MPSVRGAQPGAGGQEYEMPAGSPGLLGPREQVPNADGSSTHFLPRAHPPDLTPPSCPPCTWGCSCLPSGDLPAFHPAFLPLVHAASGQSCLHSRPPSPPTPSPTDTPCPPQPAPTCMWPRPLSPGAPTSSVGDRAPSSGRIGPALATRVFDISPSLRAWLHQVNHFCKHRQPG